MGIPRVLRCAVAVLSVGVAVCCAAPRVDIRVIQRPRPEADTPGEVWPVPFRAPADPTGPFSSANVDSIGCMNDIAAEIDGQSVLINLCHLKNITFIPAPAAVSEEAQMVDGSDSGEGTEVGVGNSNAGGEEPGKAAHQAILRRLNIKSNVLSTEPVPSSRKILGIFRGWKIDPIYKKFKYAVYDDGDTCGEYNSERFSVMVELVRATQSDATPRVFDFRKLSSCSYALRVEVFVSEYELAASSGIQTPGVLDVSDADEMLPQICGEMKCQYSHVAGRVDVVKEEIESLEKSLTELVSSDSTSVAALSVSAATSIIKSSTDVMEKSLELLHSIEQLEKAAHDARATAAQAAAATSGVAHSDVMATS